MEELNKKIEEMDKMIENTERIIREMERFEIIRNFHEKILNESQDLDLEFNKISEEELWKLLEE